MAAVAACSAPQAAAPRKETPTVTTMTTTGISAEEHARTIGAMKPPKRARPVIAVIAEHAREDRREHRSLRRAPARISPVALGF
jgi:hypothetical protein